MNNTELDRLARIGNAARPDWPTASIRTFIAKHLHDHPYRDVALVLINAATAEPRTDTPRLMLEPATWAITALALGGTEPTPIPPRYNRQAVAQAKAARTPSEDVHQLLDDTRTKLRARQETP